MVLCWPKEKISSLKGYSFTFNGKENDNEVKGDGGQQDYGLRIYDPRLARFLSVDPLTSKFPWWTPYQFAGNTPIEFIDLDGAETGAPFFMISDPGSTVLNAFNAYEVSKSLVYNALAFTFSIPNMASHMHVSGNAKHPEIKAKYENEAKNELANFVIGHMTGLAFRGLIKGVGKVLGSEASATGIGTNKTVFRGDARKPGEIFKEGFESKGGNTSIPEYVEVNEPSVFIGTSKSATTAAEKAPSGYVYAIENNGNGLDVNNYYKAIEGRENPYSFEQEIVFELKIPSSQIRGAYPIVDGKINLKGFIANPSYKPVKK
jgi:RHS repeat-associated protein